VGGKLIVSEWTICEGTNVGRANERTPHKQAIFEVNANYKKKLDKDYHMTVDTIDEGSHIVQCMLANKYTDAVLRKNPPILSTCYSQPKLDGLRCLTDKNGMWSRNGKPWLSCPHIFESLKPFFEEFPDFILDGELYNHEFHDDFNEISSIIKQPKPTLEDFAKAKEFAQYHIYDIQLPTNPNFSKRTAFLKDAIKELDSPYLIYVRTDKVIDKTHLDNLYYEEYIGAGYEGQMVREDVPYDACSPGHCWSLLKRKEFHDAEYELLDIQPGRGNWAGKAKRAVLKAPPGYPKPTFEAGITGTMKYCAKLLIEKAKYIGKPTTVNYTNLTPDGVPRHGRCKEFDRKDG
jgi:DNA ligase-1